MTTKFFHALGVSTEIFRPIEDSTHLVVAKKLCCNRLYVKLSPVEEEGPMNKAIDNTMIFSDVRMAACPSINFSVVKNDIV